VRDLVQFQIANVQGARREADYKFCKEWQPVIGKQPVVTTKYGDQRNGEMSLLADMKTEVQGDFSKIADVPVIDHGGTWSAKGPPTGAGGPHPTPWADRLTGQQKAMQGDSFATFGQDRHNAETWGNDLFGVGYSYDIGWEIPVRWETVSDPNGGTSTAVCDLGVGAHGGFEAFAYAFGSDKFGIISVDLAAGANDYTDPNVPGDPTNVELDTNLHQAAFNADLTIAGDSLVSENLGGFGTRNVPVAQGSNSWNLFTIPFQITFVTLEISVGVGYSYAVELDATPSHQDTCHQVLKQDHGPWPKPNPSQPSVGLTAALHPQGNLDGIVQAYASLAGLAGVGIQVNLTLLGIGLPLDNTLKLEPNKLTLASSLNMDFQTLDGSLSVYAEALFFQLFDIEIISWSGMHDKIPLLNTDTHVDIGALSGLGQTGLTNPAASLAGL